MRRIKRSREIDRFRGCLTAAQLETISVDNPFRKERNELIRHLYLRGVKLPLLGGISGLSKSGVHRIVTGRMKKSRNRRSGSELSESSTGKRIIVGLARERKEIQKQRLLRILPDEKIRMLNKDNPFRRERTALIYKLLQRGVSGYLLSDISGVSKSVIYRIRLKGPDYSLRRKPQGPG